MRHTGIEAMPNMIKDSVDIPYLYSALCVWVGFDKPNSSGTPSRVRSHSSLGRYSTFLPYLNQRGACAKREKVI